MTENPLQNIEAYIMGHLNESERAGFEALLEKDQVLRKEYLFQKQVIQSLKSARKTELKARLGQVEVGTSYFSWFRAAAFVGLIGLTGTGIYIWNDYQPASNRIKTAVSTEKKYAKAKTIKQDHVASKEQESPTLALNETRKKVSEKVYPVATSASENRQINKSMHLVSPKVIEDFEEHASNKDHKLNAPSNSLASIKSSQTQTLQVQMFEDSQFKLHYRFYEGKLFLYGSFNDSPYEIIELNTSAGKSTYLYYNDHFYLLLLGQIEMIPLEAITNATLIQDLSIIRKSKNSE